MAYRRPKNLRDFLVRAKIKPLSSTAPAAPKISRCNDGRCKTCDYIASDKTEYTFHNTGEKRFIPHNLSCSSENLIYMINCKRCLNDSSAPSQYIGQTCRSLRERFGEHRRGIINKLDDSVPNHFNQPNHSLNDVEVIPLIQIHNNRDSIRLAMEQHLIEKADSLRHGLNRTSDH